jgi:hypothetical protein
MEVRIFAARCARAEKVGENKTVGQQHIWGQTMLIIQTNFIIITITVAAIVYLVQQQNRQHGFCQEGSGYIPANFQAKKSHINGLGTVFVEG